MPEPKKDFISQEMEWLLDVLDWRIKKDLELSNDSYLPNQWEEFPEPKLEGDEPYINLVTKLNLSKEERLIIALSLAPQLLPGTFARYLSGLEKKHHGDVGYIEANNGIYLPTVLTAVFLLKGIHDLQSRTEAFGTILNHPLLKDGLIKASLEQESEFFLKPMMASSSLLLLLSGKISYEDLSTQKITTEPNPFLTKTL